MYVALAPSYKSILKIEFFICFSVPADSIFKRHTDFNGVTQKRIYKVLVTIFQLQR